MVNVSTVPAVRVILGISLTALLGACSLGQGPALKVVEAPAPVSVQDRFSNTGRIAEHNSVVPRASIDEANVDRDAPDVYTVIKGDTLWDISDRFLKQPWLWPTVWDYNPQIANPHLIYPGDKIALEYVNGKPTLVIARNGVVLPLDGANGSSAAGRTSVANATSLNTERLSPRIRSESLDDAIPMIPGNSIQQFLVHPQVVSSEVIDSAPYIVGNYDNRLISAIGHQIYARGNISREQTRYGVYRKNKPLRDPLSGELLGYEVQHVADAKLLNTGDPATLVITSNKLETIAGDLLLPSNNDGITHTYVPRMPEIRGEGRIISLVNAISQTGRDQVVVLNLGKRSGIKIGDVLAVEARGGSMIDTRGRSSFERIRMPNTRTGVLMVFQTFDKVSYALVMESTRPVKKYDVITGI
jgi:hypothetical protein